MKIIQKYLICLIVVTLFVVYTFNKTVANVNSISLSSKCGRYPKESDILIDNVMWQILKNHKRVLYLMNAYLDLRWNKTVVINTIGAGLNLTADKIFCQYWFEDTEQPIVVQALKFQSLWRFGKFKLLSFQCF